MDLSQHKKHKAQTRQFKNYKDKLEKYEVFRSIWNKTFESQIEMIKKLVENLENLLRFSGELLDKMDEISPQIVGQCIEPAEAGPMSQMSQNSDGIHDNVDKYKRDRSDYTA